TITALLRSACAAAMASAMRAYTLRSEASVRDPILTTMRRARVRLARSPLMSAVRAGKDVVERCLEAREDPAPDAGGRDERAGDAARPFGAARLGQDVARFRREREAVAAGDVLREGAPDATGERVGHPRNRHGAHGRAQDGVGADAPRAERLLGERANGAVLGE